MKAASVKSYETKKIDGTSSAKRREKLRRKRRRKTRIKSVELEEKIEEKAKSCAVFFGKREVANSQLMTVFLQILLLASVSLALEIGGNLE